MQLRTLLCLGVVIIAFAPELRAQQLDVCLVTDEAAAAYNRKTKDPLATWSELVVELK